jgi:hypothetical protein
MLLCFSQFTEDSLFKNQFGLEAEDLSDRAITEGGGAGGGVGVGCVCTLVCLLMAAVNQDFEIENLRLYKVNVYLACLL